MLSFPFLSRNGILYYCVLSFCLPCLFQQILFFLELAFKIQKNGGIQNSSSICEVALVFLADVLDDL